MSAFVPPVPGAAPGAPPGALRTAAPAGVGLAAAGGVVLQTRRAVGTAPAVGAAAAGARESVCGRGGDAGRGGGGGTIVVWFRGDLRVDDHPALVHAVEEGRRVVCVYCFDPRQFGKTPFGFEKTGRYRAKFLVGAVAELRDRLRAIGGELVVRRGRPEEAVVEVCRRAGARDVFYHREVSYEEQQVEDALDEACRAADVGVKRFWANTLYHCEDLPFDLADMPDVYTEFREAVQRDGVIRAPLPPPDGLPPPPKAVDAGAVPTLGDLGLSEPDAAAHGLHAFVGGEGEALRRLAAYIGETRAVPAGRSAAVHLGADFSCKISPWLALGCVSPRRIHADLSERSAKAGQTSTYFELIWRDFFRFITQKYALSRITDGKAGKGRGGGRVAAAAVARRPSGALAPVL